ncbi:MAG: response regulator [Rhodovarius sp.]|nr:response regulator [Rhodovarius sp.]
MSSSRVLRVSLILGVLSLLIVQIALNVFAVQRSHDALARQAQESIERAASSIEGAINRTFVQVDALLAGLPAMMAPFLGPAGLDERGATELLRQLNSQNFVFRDLIIARPDGTPIVTALAASRRRPLPMELSEAAPEPGQAAGGLTLSRPWRNPASGEWSVLLMRRLEMRGLGPVIAVAEMPVFSIGILLGSGGQPPGQRVFLHHTRLGVLGALPLDEGLLGRPLPEVASDPAAVFHAERATLYRHIAIHAELDRSIAMAGWLEDRQRAAVSSGAIGVLLIALLAALLFWVHVRDRAEAERQRWRAMLEDALNSMSDGFVMFDAADRLVICNESYRKMYAVSAPFIYEGAHFDDIIREGAKRGQYPQLEGDIEAFIADLRQKRRSGVMALERLLPDGRWVLITERPTRDGGTVGIRTDITALKATMAELAQARDAAQKAAAEKSMFLARMSHELRTPLNAVLGFAELLLADRRLEEGQREQLRLIHEAATHLRDMVNTLLDLSKAEAGRLELRRDAVRLAEVAEICTRLVEPECARKRIRLALHLDPKLPAMVRGDALRLRQIMLNLLSNATKFAPAEGQVELRLRLSADGGRWLIEVEDNGPGIPADRRHLLFRDFSQLATAPGGEGGTGLGLSITAQLVAAMGGSVRCIDGGLGGALFQVELPLEPAQEAEASAVREATAPPSPAPAASSPAAEGAHVLVADDVAVNRMLMRMLLEQEGHRVTLASHGREVLDLLATEKPDLLLLDVHMPLLDGLETARRIRAAEAEGEHLPIVALTASALPEQIAACEAAGMDGHLAKPVTREELLAAIARFSRKRGGGALAPPVLDQPALARLREELGPEARLALLEQIRSGIAAIAGSPPLEGEQLAERARGLAAALRRIGAEALALASEGLAQAAADPAKLEAALAAWQEARAALEPALAQIRAEEGAQPAVA